MKFLRSFVIFLFIYVGLFAAKEDYFVTADWLMENLSQEELVILDARGNKVAFMKGHIPGAQLTGWPEFSDMKGDPATNNNWGVLLGDEAIEKRLQELGVSRDSLVIVYQSPLTGFGEDARLLWMLKYVGFDNVKILDGGLEAWRKAGGKTASFAAKASKGDITLNRNRKDLVVTTEELLHQGDSFSLLDTREPEEYDGTKVYGEARLGRIPGSKNIFFLNFLDEEGMVKSKEEVDSMLLKSHIDTSKTIATYCTGGIRSALAWVALTMYGYDSANYDSSFAGWAIRTDLPVEK